MELEHGGLEAELASVIEQWRVLGLARVLVERTLKRYEAQRQPAVLRRASEQFAAVTAGRYVRIDASGEDGDRSLGLWSSAGGRLDAGQLSRGTAEQLYLCIRLAAAEQLGRHAAALPLVLDDVLVDLDPDRAAALAACLADAATRQQVLVLTCHPGHVALLTGAAPEARVVSLRPRRATPGTARAPRPSP